MKINLLVFCSLDSLPLIEAMARCFLSIASAVRGGCFHNRCSLLCKEQRRHCWGMGLALLPQSMGQSIAAVLRAAIGAGWGGGFPSLCSSALGQQVVFQLIVGR